jgi:hypothetical protein
MLTDILWATRCDNDQSDDRGDGGMKREDGLNWLRIMSSSQAFLSKPVTR